MDTIKQRNRDAEIPFDSERKLMTVIVNGKAFVKGAPDELLKRCRSIRTENGEETIDPDLFEKIERANARMADEALRVLAFAEKTVATNDVSIPDAVESELTLIGLCGMIDPPREEAKRAVADCKTAGIHVVMITGDHGATARAIARKIGILSDDAEAITGEMLNTMDDAALEAIVARTSVYARVAPEHKVRIVRALQKCGHIVAMTGDGVNDAPALKTADIGVGMGITGTDVSKAAADMVLTDDNFATIVKAVMEGRKVYQNIKKAVRFLLSSNMGEVMALFLATMFGGWLFGSAVLLAPIHILWINLVTDTFPALALGLEPTEGNVMNSPPRDPNVPLIDKRLWTAIGITGMIEAVLTLLAFGIGFAVAGQTYAMTMAFVTLGLSQLFAAFGVRSERVSVFKLGLFKNKVMVIAMLFSTLLQVGVVLVPWLRGVFSLDMLTPAHWAAVVGLSMVMLLASEIEKAFIDLRTKKKLAN